MTNRIDRLAKKGLVERLPDPNDRRGVLVRLTPRGATARTSPWPGCWPRSGRSSPGSPGASAVTSPGCYAS